MFLQDVLQCWTGRDGGGTTFYTQLEVRVRVSSGRDRVEIENGDAWGGGPPMIPPVGVISNAEPSQYAKSCNAKCRFSLSGQSDRFCHGWV